MNKTILVCDDEKNIREGLALALELEDYNVLILGDSHSYQFLKGIAENKPSIGVARRDFVDFCFDYLFSDKTGRENWKVKKQLCQRTEGYWKDKDLYEKYDTIFIVNNWAAPARKNPDRAREELFYVLPKIISRLKEHIRDTKARIVMTGAPVHFYNRKELPRITSEYSSVKELNRVAYKERRLDQKLNKKLQNLVIEIRVKVAFSVNIS